MLCPACNDPMHLARYEPGQWKKWECGRCVHSRRHRSKVPGYTGNLIINAKVKVNHQERLGELA